MAPERKYDRSVTVPQICAGLLEGKPMALVCRELDIPMRTVSKWRETDPEVAEDIDEAFDAGGDLMAWRMRMTARGRGEDEGGDSTGNTDRDKLIIYTDEKLLANWHTRYSRKMTLAGDPKNPLLPPARQLTDAELLVVAAQGAKEDQGG